MESYTCEPPNKIEEEMKFKPLSVLSFFLSSFFFFGDFEDSNPDTSALLMLSSSSLRPADFLLLSEKPNVGGGPAKKSENEQSFRPFFLIADSLKIQSIC